MRIDSERCNCKLLGLGILAITFLQLYLPLRTINIVVHNVPQVSSIISTDKIWVRIKILKSGKMETFKYGEVDEIAPLPYPNKLITVYNFSIGNPFLRDKSDIFFDFATPILKANSILGVEQPSILLDVSISMKNKYRIFNCELYKSLNNIP